MASRKKRTRGGGEAEAKPLEEQETAASLRARLLHLIDGTPSFWADIEARLGTTGVDAGLCALGREVANVIRAVGESAEAERQRLQSLRTTLHIAVDARINELLENITTAESAKIAALERELERLDAVLERTRREHAAAREAVASSSDVELNALSADLSSRLKDVSALLATLPHGPVEPSLLRLVLDEGALRSSIRTAGTVLAPRGMHAADVVVRGLPTTVRPGRPLQFELALSDGYPCRAPAELEAAAASLAFHSQVRLSLETGAESQPLQATLIPAAGGESIVVVSVAIPESTDRGAKVVVIA
jgi:bacterioferritin (cytochrome b1)